MRQNSLREHQRAILFAALATVIAWAIPVVGLLLLPLQYLNTHAHELAHAVAALGTGGSPQYIVVNANGSGMTPIVGGNILLVSSAGYIGAALLGAALIYYGRTENGSKLMMRVLAVVLMVGLLLWIRGDLIGVISAVGWIGALWVMSARLSPQNSILAAQFLGLQQCLASLQSLLTLMHVSAFGNVHSDAANMQSITGIPAVVWATGWSGFSLLLIFVALRAAWRDPIRAGR